MPPPRGMPPGTVGEGVIYERCSITLDGDPIEFGAFYNCVVKYYGGEITIKYALFGDCTFDFHIEGTPPQRAQELIASILSTAAPFEVQFGVPVRPLV
jgi:hypothetical protein